MKLLASIFSAMFLVACGSGEERPADIVSWNGVEYRFEGAPWDELQVNVAEDKLIRNLIENRIFAAKDVVRILKDVRVYVATDILTCERIDEKTKERVKEGCFGYQSGYDLHVQDKGCPHNSATPHEMGHLLQTSIDGWIDYRHLDFQYWRLVEDSGGSCE